jgi:predicted GNAT family N-acyltransferase
MAPYDLRLVDDGAALAHAHAVRRCVFIDEQDVPEAVEMDDRDDEATHVVAFGPDDGEPVGTARIRTLDDETAKIERVAVLPDERGNGLGAHLMARAEATARDQGCRRVRLHAQVAVESFYQRLGYQTVSDTFDQAGIEHVEMTKSL